MTLQNPAAFFWLLPLGGVIVLLYLLKMRRRDVRVPASFLWPARTDEVRANSLFQRLKFSWLLLLQLLALSLLVAALARPQTKQNTLTGEITVLVLDSSASMGATDIQPSRFEDAKRQAKEAIQGARPGDRIALIEAGPSPRVVFPLSSDPARQVRRLAEVQRTDAETGVGEALRLAAALVGSEASARIVLLSDGVFEPVKNFAPGKATLVYKRIGESGDNLAVSALGTAETTQGRQLYCGVKNYSRKLMGGTINLFADGNLIDSQKFTVTPGVTWGKTIPAPAAAKVFEAKLDAPDDLKADNYAVALANPGASLHVLLISNGNLFLERALALDPRVTLDRASSVPDTEKASSVGPGRYDLVVFDGITEIAVKARGVLTFGAAGSPSPVKVLGRLKSPQFLSSEKTPVMESVDLAGVFIGSAEQVKAKPIGEVLAQSKDGPLVVAARGDKRQLYVAFAPMQSDFPLQVAFPIFIANALDFLGGESNGDLLSVKAGSPFSVPILSAAILQTPEGNRLTIRPTSSALVVRDARTIGRYTLDAEGKHKTVYASLRSERESSILPATDVPIGTGNVRATQAPARFADFWKPLLALALLALAGEWWLYARRS